MNEELSIDPMGESTLSEKLKAFKKQRLAKEIKRVVKPGRSALQPTEQVIKKQPKLSDLEV